MAVELGDTGSSLACAGAHKPSCAAPVSTITNCLVLSFALSQRGLAPRVFDYLFQKITDQENARGPDTVKYNCRCAFLEIYNETIADLLCPSANNLPIREDPEKGPYVDHLSEPIALNGEPDPCPAILCLSTHARLTTRFTVAQRSCS